MTRQAIGAIEAGLSAPSTAVALRLARALGCRVEDLFWLEDDGPEVEAEAVVDGDGFDPSSPIPCALLRTGDRWIAHPLRGKRACVTTLVPPDGVALAKADSSTSGHFPGAMRRWRIRLLDRPEAVAQGVIIAGCAPELSLWAQAAEAVHGSLRIRRFDVNSLAALQLTAAGADREAEGTDAQGSTPAGGRSEDGSADGPAPGA